MVRCAIRDKFGTATSRKQYFEKLANLADNSCFHTRFGGFSVDVSG